MEDPSLSKNKEKARRRKGQAGNQKQDRLAQALKENLTRRKAPSAQDEDMAS